MLNIICFPKKWFHPSYALTDHHTNDTHKCDAYTTSTNVITIKSPRYSMCNYYPCTLKIYNEEFASSEHAYQWRFLTYLGIHDLAEEVRKAPSAAEAKAIASRVPSHLHNEWHTIKQQIMKDILHVKADYCSRFKSDLLNSGSSTLVESVRGDIFWSSGLSPTHDATTKPQYFRGSNILGHVLEQVRNDLMKEAVLSEQHDINDKNPSDIPHTYLLLT